MPRLLTGLLLLFLCNVVIADEIRPAYLELNQDNPDTYSFLWKVPLAKNKKIQLHLQLPAICSDKTITVTQRINSAQLQRGYIQCSDTIIGQHIKIDGISAANTDVLLRIKWLDGSISTALLKPSNPFYRIPEKHTTTDIAITYLALGTTHILLGFDHLLFVFALLLIVKNARRLITTITSFTLAHSITLGAATLGFVHIPQQPVEAVIALSILFLAVEIVHGKQGRSGYAARWPWLIAFIFGLLHGFGFAGALAEVGLPQQAIPTALIFFNIGVEAGQLLFISCILLPGWLLYRFQLTKLLNRAEMVATYAIGSLSTFWLFERISLF